MAFNNGKTVLPSVTAVILAGGRSSRMGQDKNLITINGQPLIERTCQIALAVADTVKVVTPWPQRYQAVVPKNVQFVVESPSAKFRGPATGLVNSMEACRSDWILALACDLPCLQAATLRQWRSQLSLLAPQITAFLPFRNERWEPLCGFYHSSCHSRLRTYTKTSRGSFQGWLAQEKVASIPKVESQQLFNLNTPHDLNKLKEGGHRIALADRPIR